MDRFFALEWGGQPFILFGPAHLAALACVLAASAWVLGPGRRVGPAAAARLRYGLAGLLIVNELAFHAWHLAHGLWTIQTMLPLHVCSVLIWLGAAMLIGGSYRIFEFAYLLGIGGALQALLTPDAGAYGFPHFRAFQTMISHGGIIVGALMMVAFADYRPTWGSVSRVLVGANLYMLCVGAVNWLLGSNYLFIARKPPTASLLDLLGPWPWYILGIEAIGLVTVLLLYAPYAIGDLRQRATISPSSSRR